MLSKIRQEIRGIAQANIQAPLLKIMDVLEIMGADEAIHNHELELETLEGENDYVQRNLPEEKECQVEPVQDTPSSPVEEKLEEDNAEEERNTEQTESDAPVEAGERE